MEKNLTSDEIDLREVFQTIWKKKINVLLSIVISLFIALLIQFSTPKPDKIIEVNAITKITPIKIVDQSKYQIYNSILKIIRPKSSGKPITYVGSKKTITEDGKVTVNENKKQLPEVDFTIKNSEINNISKNFLLEMFFETVSERSNLINSIKKFNLIKEEDYLNKIEYETAIREILSKIRILNILNPKNKVPKMTIEYQTHDIERWQNFLKFLELETNLIIQSKLVEMFENYLTHTKMIKKFKEEDLKFQLLVADNDQQKMDVNKEIIDLEANRYIERIATMFRASPMSDKEEFYAAKIDYESSDYLQINNYDGTISLKTLYTLATLIGAILGIFFVLIVNAVQKRS